ncbi:MAG: hypothetical protein ACLSHC_01015 [Bilophila wadsworthia]
MRTKSRIINEAEAYRNEPSQGARPRRGVENQAQASRKPVSAMPR